ncbi:uncharacterized protein LOC119188863 [Manduca sexta]|uniref:uncharacterized protein LOC119188863 n=1 Tax=Manduca sexta TaxID=7130 RepID=UPI00188F33E4|nr:uncharacterized protein LOC119188863 [Manduca sexta]
MFKIKMLYLMLFVISVYGKEIEDDSGKYQYMEIFRNIPRLFEYFLSRLAEKPEVLEKDDITVFVRSANFNHEYGRGKRDGYCEDLDKPTEKEVKRETTCTLSDLPNESKSLTASETKRQSDININDSDQQFNKDIGEMKDDGDKKSEQTKRGVNSNYNNIKQYCLTQSYAKNCNTENCDTYCNHNVKRDAINRNYEVDTSIRTTRKQYNLTNKKLDEMNTKNILKIKNVNEKLNKVTKKIKNYGKRYAAAESAFFNLSPEDVENTVLMVEQMLEKHNNKKSKEVD